MDCAKAKDLTARAVSGNASPADDAALRAHAAACPDCAEALTRARKVWALMGRLPAARATRPVDPATLIRRRPLPRWAAAVAAAAVLAAAAALLFRPSPQAPAPVAERPEVIEFPPAAPSPEQVRAERQLETAVREEETRKEQEKAEARAPKPEDVKPPAPAPEKAIDAPLVVRPAPAPSPEPTPEKKKPEVTAKTETPPAPPKPAAPSRDTLPLAATVDRADGQVVATINGEAVPVSASFRLTDTDALATLGKNSQAVLAYDDGTRVVLGGDTAVGRVLRRGEGRRIEVLHGVVAAQVARRAGDDPLTFSTPNAEARVVGTRLILLVGAASTRLDVKEGKVKLVRKEDGASVDVSADHFAIAAKGTSLASRAIPGPKVALREEFERGRWSPVWTAQSDAGQGIKASVQADALVFAVERTSGPDVSPSTLPNDPGPLKKTFDDVRRIAALASKKDWPRAVALETKSAFAFSNEAPLRVRLNAWHSGADPDRLFWLGLNRGTPGQGVSLERKGDVLELRVDGAADPLWSKALPCAKEWESLELWLTKDRVALRRDGLTMATAANPLKTKAARISTGTCAKAELKGDAETRLDDLEAAWLSKEDFDHISR